MEAHRPCPDSALLAAFLDGSLADYERTAVVTHLAECPQCRAVALTVVEFQEVKALDKLWETRSIPTPPPLVATGAHRWAREKTRAPALAAIGAVVVAAAALAIPLSHLISEWSAQRAMTTFIDVAEGHRPLEARLSGTHAYAPPRPPHLPGAATPRSTIQLTSAATDIRSTFGDHDAALSRQAVGVAALLVGDLDDAISTFEIAVAADGGDPKLSNDLAAAYYERAKRGNRPDDLPAALSAVERAISVHPFQLEALFNRALIITALGLRAEAESAWQDYLARDPGSAWATEAHGRLSAVRSSDPRTEWSTLLQGLEATNSTESADAAVKHQASATRHYIENSLLKRWVAAAKANDLTGEDLVLARIQLLGESFVRVAADRMYDDFVKTIRAARIAGMSSHAIAAHEEYLAGLELMARQSFADAAPVLMRAARRLTAVRSPLSLRAQLELAATTYYDGRLAEAAGALAALKVAARERQHANLVTRAAWLEGMTAFRRNQFAQSRIAYEEMLASAVSAGDTDQVVMANVLLANLHDMLGDVGRAWQYRITAASRLSEVFNETIRLNHLLSAAGDAQAGGHHAAALLFQSLILSGTSVPPNLEVQARAQRARSLFRLGRQADASAQLKLARAGIADVVAVVSRLVVEADVLSVEADIWRESDRAGAAAAVEKLLALPVLRDDHLRRARAQLQLAEIVLADGNLDWAARALDEGFAALEAFRSNPAAEFAIRASDSVWRLYGNAAQIALRRGDLAGAFSHLERARIRTSEERRAWGERIASLDEVQRSLAQDTALAVLTQFDDRLQIWVIRHDDVATHTLPISPVRATALIARQIREMVRGDATPLGSGELFDAVLLPVAGLLQDASRLVVIADAPYDRIAFAGLWDRRRDRYVVEDHAVMLEPNATAFARAAGLAPPAGPAPSLRHASIVGSPDGRPSAPTAVMAESLTAVYGATRMTRHHPATASHLFEVVATGDVIHVTARVNPNNEFPSLSHVQLADDPGHRYSGTVFARAVSNSTPSARLVALESGPGGSISPRAEGAFGFAHALLAAGVPNVVSPVADVEPSSVERTWLDFHRHYAEGTAAVESLRRAQLAALSASDRRPGPWATLTVFGSTQ